MRYSRYEIAINQTEYKDERIHSIFKLIHRNDASFWHRKQNTDFCLHYSSFMVDDISWNEMCSFLKSNHAYKVAMYFLYHLLQQHLYCGEYSDALYEHISIFDPEQYNPNETFYRIFCFDDIGNFLSTGKISDKYLPIKHYYSRLSFADERLEEIISDIYYSNDGRKRAHANASFLEKYSKMKVEDISWTEICEDADNFSCHMFAFYIIYHLLLRHIYHNDYAESLYGHMDIFKKIYEDGKFVAGRYSHSFMCGDKITGLNTLPSVSGKSHVFFFLDSQNPFFRDVFINFYKYERTTQTPQWNDIDVVWKFEQSLGRYRDSISTYSDFNEHTFWEQINWFKTEYSDSKKRKLSITVVLQFYRWLVRTFPKYNFFNDAFTMSSSLLFTEKVHNYINEDYFFTIFNPATPPLNRDKICFILRGFNKYTTKLKQEDFLTIDLSVVQQRAYRDTILRYMMTIPEINFFTSSSNLGYLFDGLNFLTALKNQDNYPNSSYDYFSNQEAVLLRKMIIDTNKSKYTKNNILYTIRHFLTWCRDGEVYEFDDLFFDYLKSYNNNKEPSNSESISDEDLSKIVHFMEVDAKENHIAVLCLAITRLLIETKFRIGTICHLTTDCIRPTMKQNQYRLIGYQKTGHGKPDEAIINNITYRIIMNAIEATEELREACSVQSVHDYIFLQKSNIRDHVSVLRVADYRNYLTYACNSVGVKRYTPNNLRDTHMTKALEYAIRHGRSDIELSVLTGHKSAGTTKNHYIDWKMEEMLEATYGIDLSTDDYLNRNFNIVDSIPLEYNCTGTEVENGCGHCIASECKMQSVLPCLMCKDFITTTGHQKYFERTIDDIQRMIDNCHGTKHDIEDLITIKKLYVTFLGMILQKKGEIVNE